MRNVGLVQLAHHVGSVAGPIISFQVSDWIHRYRDAFPVERGWDTPEGFNDFCGAITGSVDAAERFRLKLLPNTFIKVVEERKKDKGQLAIWKAGLYDAHSNLQPIGMAEHSFESLARVMVVLNTIIQLTEERNKQK